MPNQHYGAHEIMEMHEVLNTAIDGINTLQLYMPLIRDEELHHIVGNQLRFMIDEYNRLVHLVNGRGAGQAIPYRGVSAVTAMATAPMTMSTVNPSNPQLDDRDVASVALSLHKSTARLRLNAALECADPEMRQALVQGTTNCVNQAYEVWGYMNRRGYYPLATMQESEQTQLLRGYQPLAADLTRPAIPAMPQPAMVTSPQGQWPGTAAPLYQQPVSQILSSTGGIGSATSAFGGAAGAFGGATSAYGGAAGAFGGGALQAGTEAIVSGQPVSSASQIFSSPVYREQATYEATESAQAGELMNAVSSPADNPTPGRSPAKRKSAPSTTTES